jgi:hypothetical protein
LADLPPRALHEALRRFLLEESGLTLTPPAPTPLDWQVRHVLDWAALILLVVGGIVTLPLTLIPLLLLVWRLRTLENSDPVVAPRPGEALTKSLSRLEDYGVTNQFSAMGTLKPGWLRARILSLVLWIINLTAGLIYTSGRLARVHTIHFARWVYLDNRSRLFFASNYDGSLDSYMDDFINKVAFGLNLVFSNGLGYPRTRFLVLGGAKDEQVFKRFLRRHQIPTEVWYKAYPGLTAFDLAVNTRIREGLEHDSMSETETRHWLALI